MRNINEPALETKATAVISHHFTCCVNYQGWKLKYHAAFQDANEWDGIISYLGLFKPMVPTKSQCRMHCSESFLGR